MAKATLHRATVTLKLPFHTDSEAELRTLRAAGIPVDDRGAAASGFLHVRTTADYRSRVFRWFADSNPAEASGTPQGG